MLSTLHVALAALLLFGPMLTSAVAVARRPALAGGFMPPAMIERARGSVERARARTGYIPDPEAERQALASLEAWKAERDQAGVDEALARLAADAKTGTNLMQATLAAARAGATVRLAGGAGEGGRRAACLAGWRSRSTTTRNGL